MNTGKFFWGTIIVFAGLILLAENLGLFPREFWLQIWKLWPIILIFLGLGFIFGKERKSVWLIVGIIILILIFAGGFVLWGNVTNSRSLVKSDIKELVDGQATSAELDVNFGAANLIISETSDQNIVTGSINTIGKPEIINQVNGNKQKIIINQLKNGPNFWIPNQGKDELDLKLTDKIPIDLFVNTGASKFDLNLENIKLTNLNINCGASSGRIKIGSETKDINVIVKSGASNFNLIVPKNAGLNIINKSGLSGNNFNNLGLVKNGQNYKSTNFETALQKVNISFEAGVSSLNIEQN